MLCSGWSKGVCRMSMKMSLKAASCVSMWSLFAALSQPYRMATFSPTYGRCWTLAAFQGLPALIIRAISAGGGSSSLNPEVNSDLCIAPARDWVPPQLDQHWLPRNACGHQLQLRLLHLAGRRLPKGLVSSNILQHDWIPVVRFLARVVACAGSYANAMQG